MQTEREETAFLTLLTYPLAYIIGCCGPHSMYIARIASLPPARLTASRAHACLQDLAAFLLVRGPYAWLGWGWKGCSQE
jgi:hypothetical protein